MFAEFWPTCWKHKSSCQKLFQIPNLLFLIIVLIYLLNEAAAYLGALPAKESICVTQPFQSENCSKSNPIKILELHSSEGIDAIVLRTHADSGPL